MNEQTELLIRAVESVMDSPCETCSKAEQCATRGLACGVFGDFVDGAEKSNRKRTPKRRWYRDIFTDSEQFGDAAYLGW